jgi:hypothetical protein
MEISTKEELKDTVNKINILLQAVQAYCNRDHIPAGTIKFLQGFLRNCQQIRRDYVFIKEEHIRGPVEEVTKWAFEKISSFKVIN